MKAKTVSIDITYSCDKNWDEMSPLPNGKFCSHCEKTVVDFTSFSDAELALFFQKDRGNICGRLSTKQLNRPLSIPLAPSRLHKLKIAGALAAGLMIAGQTTLAQSQPPIVQQEVSLHAQTPEGDTLPNASTNITGKVTDELGQPLMFATIVIYANGTLLGGTETGLDGTFKVNIPENSGELTLYCSYVGFEKQELTLKKEQPGPIEIQMLAAKTTLPQVEVVAYRPPLVQVGVVTGLTIVRTAETRKFEPKSVSTPPPSPYQVFPNPFTDYLSIEIEHEKEELLLFHLYNSNGALVFAESQQVVAGKQVIDLTSLNPNLPAGSYFLKLSDTDGVELVVKKVIKQ